MKIAIITNSSTGLFNFRRELIQYLVKENEVIAITPNSGNISNIEKLGCRVIDTPIDRRGMNPIKDILLFKLYEEILKEEKPELVITYTIKPNIYGGLAAMRKKISYAANITGLGTAFQGNGVLKKMVVAMYKIAFRKAKVVFFENEENRNIFVKEGIIGKNKTCLLAGAGVNLELYTVIDYPEGETTRFLFMGRVMKEKGIEELFFVMRKLIMEGFNVHLDVLGSYEEGYQAIIEKYEAEGWLTYHGYQKDVKPFISQCHCFVLPSWHEGMANTNLESAASGRPVITSNIHGCLEAVDNGVTGYLTERKNSDELYKVMKKFLNLSYEERKAMGLAGRKRMEEIFDKNIVVSDTLTHLFWENDF